MAEVSGRLLSYFVACERKGWIDLDALLEGLPIDRRDVERRRQRLDWNLFAELCERLAAALGGEEQVAATIDLLPETEIPGPLARLGGAFASPRELYRVGLGFIAPSLYPGLELGHRLLPDGRLHVTARIPQELRGCHPWMLLFERTVQILPRFLSLPDAVVARRSLGPRSADLVVTLPESRSLFARFRLAWQVWRTNAVAEELEAQQRILLETQRTLQQLEGSFRRVLEALPTGIALHEEGRIEWANPAFKELLGIEGRGDVQLRDHVLPEDGGRVEEVLARSGARAELRVRSQSDELRLTRALGIRGVEFRGRPLDLLLLSDQTRERQVLRDLRAKQRALRAIGHAIPDLVLLIDREGRLRDFIVGSEMGHLPDLQPLLDRDLREVVGTLPGLPSEETLEEAFRLVARAQRTGRLQEISLEASPLGESRHFECRIVPSEADELVLLIRDETVRKRMESQLAISERMASLGTLAAGVAHEVSNPLTYVVANLEDVAAHLEGIARASPSELRKLKESIAEAMDGAARVARIVDDLRSFSRVSDQRHKGCDLRACLATALRLAASELRDRAAVHRRLEEIPTVDGDPGQLVQVFVNLLVNAAESIEGRGNIWVSTHTGPEGGAVVELRDDGHGIPAEVVHRIFDPFFTTRPGTGTGLGLAICHRIVAAHGGQMTVESAVGRGTTFTVTLPRAQEPRGEAEEQPARPAMPAVSGSPRITVVDDEPVIGRLVGRALEGFQVTVHSDPRRALEQLLESPPDLVLCDLTMPGMSGMELFARLPASLQQRVVFLSGGATSEQGRAFLERVERPTLQKPIGSAELRERVTQLLDAWRRVPR